MLFLFVQPLIHPPHSTPVQLPLGKYVTNKSRMGIQTLGLNVKSESNWDYLLGGARVEMAPDQVGSI